MPRFTVTANDRHFQAISNILTNLLLFSDAAHKMRADRLERMLFNYDFTNLASAADVVAKLQSRLRAAVETKREAEWKLQGHGDLDEVEKLKIEAHILLLAEELDYVFEAIKLAQDKADGLAAQKSALLLHASSSEISWRMIDRHEQLLAKLAVRDIDFRWLNRQDSSTVNNLAVGDLQAFDGAADAEWTEILSKHDEPASHPLVKVCALHSCLMSIPSSLKPASTAQAVLCCGLDRLAPRRRYHHLPMLRTDSASDAPANRHPRRPPHHGIHVARAPKARHGEHPRGSGDGRAASAALGALLPGRRAQPAAHADAGRALAAAAAPAAHVRGHPVADARRHARGAGAAEDGDVALVHGPAQGGERLAAGAGAAAPAADAVERRLVCAGGGELDGADVEGGREGVDAQAGDGRCGGHEDAVVAEDLCLGESLQVCCARTVAIALTPISLLSLHLLLSIMKEDSFLCRDARIRTRDLEYRNQTWSVSTPWH